MVWVRLTPQAGLLELREDYMAGAEEVYGSLADALTVLLPKLMPLRIRVEGWGRGGGVFAESCFEGLSYETRVSPRRWEYEGPSPAVLSLGRYVEWVARNRSKTRLAYDGIVDRSTIPLRTLVLVLEPLQRWQGMRVRLLLASNWLLGETRKRFGRDNAIYIEYDNPPVLESLARRVMDGRVEAYTPRITPFEWHEPLRRARQRCRRYRVEHRAPEKQAPAYVDFCFMEENRIDYTVCGLYWAATVVPTHLAPVGIRAMVVCEDGREMGELLDWPERVELPPC